MRMEQQRSERGTGRLTRHARQQSIDNVHASSMQVRQFHSMLLASAWCHLVRSFIHRQPVLPLLNVHVLTRLSVDYAVDQGCGCACGLHFHTLRPYPFPQAGIRTLHALNNLHDALPAWGRGL